MAALRYWDGQWWLELDGATVTATYTPPTAPSPPAAPTFANIAQTTLRVNWTTVAGATSYTLQRATDSGFTANLFSVPNPANPYDDSSLTANTQYWYRIVATATPAARRTARADHRHDSRCGHSPVRLPGRRPM